MKPKKDPTNPSDLVGRPLEVGDYIAYPTTTGSSADMTVARIEKINFKKRAIRFKHDGTPYESQYEYEDCPQHAAQKYTLYVQPIEWTGFYWSAGRTRNLPRCVTLQKVHNAVKVQPL